MTAVTVIITAAVIVLVAAAALSLVRMVAGPSALDRAVSADVMVAVVIAALATEASVNQHATTVPIMVVLALVGFTGSLSMARFVAGQDASGNWEAPKSWPEGEGPR